MKRTPLKRGKPLRRHVPLRARPQPIQYGKVRAWIADRADGWCEIQVPGICTRRGVHAHHLLPRSAGRDDSMGNLVWACSECHRHVHENPAWAYEHGWLRRRTA